MRNPLHSYYHWATRDDRLTSTQKLLLLMPTGLLLFASVALAQFHSYADDVVFYMAFAWGFYVIVASTIDWVSGVRRGVKDAFFRNTDG